MRTYRTLSSAETKSLGADTAKDLLAKASGRTAAPRSGAAVITLHGDLGAGKTTFTQGFLRALGVRGRVTSPTFVLMKRSYLPGAGKAGFTNVYHIDAYRFRAAREAAALDLKKIFKDPGAIVLVEWPERLKGLLPRRTVAVRFAHGGKENERVIKVS